MNEPIISINSVSKSFGLQKVLSNVSLQCFSGGIYGLIGRNGSGKTVLMKCVLGLLSPDSGEITVCGKRIGKDADFADAVGFIIENPGFLPHETALRNLKYLASIRGCITLERVKTCISFVGLDPNSKKKVGKFSMGMRQRLGIAQAIMENPDILMLDEPMNGLDNSGVGEIRAMLKALRSDGKTVILASHNREDIEILCDHVYEMDGGILMPTERRIL
jgi:ABC-2 type transport system ATP-binding protein